MKIKQVCMLFAVLLCFAAVFASIANVSVDVAAMEEPFGKADATEIDEQLSSGYHQLTEEELALDTRALIELVLQNRYVAEHLCSNSSDPQVYYQWLYGEFNGIRELETRDDAGSALVDILCYSVNMLSSTWAKDDIAEIDGNVYDYTIVHNCIFLLEQPEFATQLSSEEQARERDALQLLNEQRDAERAGEEQYQLTTVSSAAAVDQYEKRTIYTIGGREVEAFRLLSADYTTADITSINYTYASNFPKAVLIYNPTKVYNCHSYAWYEESKQNPYWINYPTGYFEDGHVTVASGKGIGFIAVYMVDGEAKHSAIVKRIRGSTITCQSKWGVAGMYEHTLEDVPASYKENGKVNVVYYIFKREHSYSISYTDSYHTLTCAYCPKPQTEPHQNIITSTAMTHTLSCKVCNYSKEEAHKLDATGTRCTVCRRAGPFPVTPTRIPLANKVQMVQLAD